MLEKKWHKNICKNDKLLFNLFLYVSKKNHFF